MTAPVKDFLSQVKIGARQTHENMTLYCLLMAQEASVEFMTLDEALDKKALVITEVTEGGSVSQLKVKNKSDQKVLMLDGEELVGAKQNRVLNVTILVAAHSETIIPVSCVEEGRWSYRGRRFRSESRAMSASLKRQKSETVLNNLRRQSSFHSDQGAVWMGIENKYIQMRTKRSGTMAMADLYKSHKHRTNAYVKEFRPVTNQVGIIIFIDGELAGVELFGCSETLRKTHSKLVGSYVMDALETAELRKKVVGKALKAKAAKLLQTAQAASTEIRRSVALGNDLRLESNGLMGAGLEFEGQVLQLSIFGKN